MSRPVVIGIAGGSGSGKTTVLNRIVDAVGSSKIAVLDHDSYYLDLSHLTLEERGNFNVDHPAALESDLLVQHLKDLLEGHPGIQTCIRLYASHPNRRDGDDSTPPRDYY